MKHSNIQVPLPCPSNWKEMNPKDNGRFCSSCSKTVVDFTGMTDEEIKSYFSCHTSEKTCGRFLDIQLDGKENILLSTRDRLLKKTSGPLRYAAVFFLGIAIAAMGCGKRTMGEPAMPAATDEGIVLDSTHVHAPVNAE